MQRCSPPYGEEPLQKLWSYKVCFPEIWDKMSERVHGANTAIRYALTELYAYGGRPEKPANVSWEDYLVTIIKRHDPEVIPMIAKRIQQEIKAHFNKTNDPILNETPHPDTGLNWDFLLMVAMRGDFKGRKQVGGEIKANKTKEQQWEEYNNAREREMGGNEDHETRTQRTTFSKY
jgi:predicted phosphoadenosine phosphosulfate sulfurtransferase